MKVIRRPEIQSSVLANVEFKAGFEIIEIATLIWLILFDYLSRKIRPRLIKSVDIRAW